MGVLIGQRIVVTQMQNVIRQSIKKKKIIHQQTDLTIKFKITNSIIIFTFLIPFNNYLSNNIMPIKWTNQVRGSALNYLNWDNIFICEFSGFQRQYDQIGSSTTLPANFSPIIKNKHLQLVKINDQIFKLWLLKNQSCSYPLLYKNSHNEEIQFIGFVFSQKNIKSFEVKFIIFRSLQNKNINIYNFFGQKFYRKQIILDQQSYINCQFSQQFVEVEYFEKLIQMIKAQIPTLITPFMPNNRHSCIYLNDIIRSKNNQIENLRQNNNKLSRNLSLKNQQIKKLLQIIKLLGLTHNEINDFLIKRNNKQSQSDNTQFQYVNGYLNHINTQNQIFDLPKQKYFEFQLNSSERNSKQIQIRQAKSQNDNLGRNYSNNQNINYFNSLNVDIKTKAKWNLKFKDIQFALFVNIKILIVLIFIFIASLSFLFFKQDLPSLSSFITEHLYTKNINSNKQISPEAEQKQQSLFRKANDLIVQSLYVINSNNLNQKTLGSKVQNAIKFRNALLIQDDQLLKPFFHKIQSLDQKTHYHVNFDLSSQKMRKNYQNWKNMFQQIHEQSTIVNTIRQNYLSSIFRYLKISTFNYSSVQLLNLQNNNICDQNIQQFSQTLKQYINLKTLNLQGNQLTHLKFLNQSQQNIKQLRLSNNPLNQYSLKTVLKIKFTSLETLSYSFQSGKNQQGWKLFLMNINRWENLPNLKNIIISFSEELSNSVRRQLLIYIQNHKNYPSIQWLDRTGLLSFGKNQNFNTQNYKKLFIKASQVTQNIQEIQIQQQNNLKLNNGLVADQKIILQQMNAQSNRSSLQDAQQKISQAKQTITQVKQIISQIKQIINEQDEIKCQQKLIQSDQNQMKSEITYKIVDQPQKIVQYKILRQVRNINPRKIYRAPIQPSKLTYKKPTNEIKKPQIQIKKTIINLNKYNKHPKNSFKGKFEIKVEEKLKQLQINKPKQGISQEKIKVTQIQTILTSSNDQNDAYLNKKSQLGQIKAQNTQPNNQHLQYELVSTQQIQNQKELIHENDIILNKNDIINQQSPIINQQDFILQPTSIKIALINTKIDQTSMKDIKIEPTDTKDNQEKEKLSISLRNKDGRILLKNSQKQAYRRKVRLNQPQKISIKHHQNIIPKNKLKIQPMRNNKK